MKYTIHGFNQIEVMKINQELGMEIKLKREPNWNYNTEDIVLNNGKTRKRPAPKLPKIGETELLLLRWFVDFYGTSKMTKLTINGELYGYVKYKAVLEDLPILDISKETLRLTFSNLVDFKILKHETIKNEMGTFAVYYFGENYVRLIEQVKSINTELGCIENKARVH